MTSDLHRAICVIAVENGLKWDGKNFVDQEGNKYAITRFGLVPNINHNYGILYKQIFKDVDYQRHLVKRLKEENERLHQDMIHKKSRNAILSMLDSDTPENVIERIKNYLS